MSDNEVSQWFDGLLLEDEAKDVVAATQEYVDKLLGRVASLEAEVRDERAGADAWHSRCKAALAERDAERAEVLRLREALTGIRDGRFANFSKFSLTFKEMARTVQDHAAK